VSGYPEPPYFLLLAGLLASLAAGSAFDVSLKQLVADWNRTRSTRIVSSLRGSPVFLPFLGIAGGVCVFLGSGLTIFGFPFQLSLILSLILTVGTAALVWSQLGKLLMLLQKGGSRALDLDAFE
jgi:hypothetical protein